MWRSTEIDEKTIELTYVEGLSVDDASKLVVVRMPLEADEARSLAFSRLLTLQMARDVIGQEITRLKLVVDRQS